MKRKNIKAVYLFIILICTVCVNNSCTDYYAEINTDKNSISTVGSAEIPFLFAKAISSVPWNGQVEQNLYADQYAQYFANNTTYFPTDRLVIDHSWAQEPWNIQYTQVVPQLQTIFENYDVSSVEYALANIWWVYSFNRITDYWGPIPYTQAGVPGKSVPYDSLDVIYDDFFKRLDDAVNVLKDKTDEHPFGSFDIVYGGDVSKWIKFANTLRLRLALRISNVNPDRAKIEAELAYSAGVMLNSPEDDALAPKNDLDFNDISQMSEWNEFRMTAAMESALSGYEDPRISEYFIPAVETGTYEGLRNGLSTSQLSDPMNTASANSHVGPRWTSPNSGGIPDYLSTPATIISTAEAYFLRAEGSLLGWNMGSTTKELYEAGIINSMKQWGITNETIIQDYLTSTATPIAPNDFLDSPAISDVAVMFDPVDTSVQLEQIAIQKWLALFPDGVEAWADFRRRHVLGLYSVANSDNPDIPDPTSNWIRRLPFLISEYQTNGPEVEKAVEFLGGPDKISTPLWWDKN